jgi:uncharacterized damage-inducible protein DinB
VADDTFGARSSERVMLSGFLDWYRAVVARKVEGLSDEQASRVMTSSGLSALGVVRHLTWVERLWFRWRVAGEDVTLFTGPDNSVTFRLEPADTVASVLASYRAEIEQAQRITRAAETLDSLGAHDHPIYGPVSLRWVLVHLIEETARHAGHLDLLREQLDGKTGD